MKINVFEGSRRILYLAMLLVLLVGVVASVMEKPFISVDYEVTWVGKAPEKVKDCDSSLPYRYKTIYRNRSSIWVNLCFRTFSAPDNTLLVPVQVDGHKVMGFPQYAQQASEYMDREMAGFSLRPSDFAWLDQEISEKRRAAIYVYLGFALAFAAVLWVLGSLVGWIVRGFLGIPRRADSKGE